MFGPISYSRKILLILMGTSLVVTLLSMLIALFFTLRNSEDALSEKLQSIAYMLAESSTTALQSHSPKRLEDTLSSVASIAQANQIVIFDVQGDIFAQYNPEQIPLPLSHKDENFIMDHDNVRFYMMVVDEDKVIGSLHIQADLTNYKSDIYRQAFYVGLFFFTLLLFVFFVSRKMQRVLSEPILSLAKTAAMIRDEQNFGIRVSTSQVSEEIVMLYETFNDMLSKIEQRELQRDVAEEETRKYQSHLEILAEDLEDRVTKRTEDLQKSMKDLQDAQIQLVESEKMAALGNLVGGVAHEVNTPLGNAIIALSVLIDTTKSLQNGFENNVLKRSEFIKNLALLSDSALMISSNVHRAADLIRSFKKISIDQISDEGRDFRLGEYSEEVFTTFKSGLKQAKVDWHIIMKEDQVISSYPGVYAQILSNLIQNALLHAFDGVSDPKITLEIEVKDDDIYLSFKDNGVGIDPDIRERIFEPFVTTKRNQGGSGLGLNIVYNLVMQKLHGTIEIISEKSKGSEFKIRFTKENR